MTGAEGKSFLSSPEGIGGVIVDASGRVSTAGLHHPSHFHPSAPSSSGNLAPTQMVDGGGGHRQQHPSNQGTTTHNISNNNKNSANTTGEARSSNKSDNYHNKPNDSGANNYTASSPSATQVRKQQQEQQYNNNDNNNGNNAGNTNTNASSNKEPSSSSSAPLPPPLTQSSSNRAYDYEGYVRKLKDGVKFAQRYLVLTSKTLEVLEDPTKPRGRRPLHLNRIRIADVPEIDDIGREAANILIPLDNPSQVNNPNVQPHVQNISVVGHGGEQVIYPHQLAKDCCMMIRTIDGHRYFFTTDDRESWIRAINAALGAADFD